MILTPHLLAGAAIGSKTHNWWTIAVLSIASHYLIDSIPHPEYKLRFFKTKSINRENAIDLLKVAGDLACGFFLVFLIGEKSVNFSYMAFGMIMAILPDFFQLFYHIHKNKISIFIQKIHDYFHFDENRLFAWHGVFSVIVIIVSITALIAK